MKTTIKTVLGLIIALVGCADTVGQPFVTEDTGALWVCHTHATTGADTFDQAHDVCLAPSKHDVQDVGDGSVADWIHGWAAICFADGGRYCTAECYPQFTACEANGG